jgi:hypothetical protein
LLSLQAQPAPWLKLVNLVSVIYATPFPSQFGSDIRTFVQRDVEVEILTYAPTEFFHCQHCEVVWDSVGFGKRIRAEQRAAALPADLQAEFTAIADWAAAAHERYGDRLRISVVDVASVEGVVKAIRHRARRFPAFIVDGREALVGFDAERLDAALERRVVLSPRSS